MEQAGHKCVGHCEIDKYADISYRSMHTITEEQRDKLMKLPLKERQNEIRKEEYLNGEWYADDIRTVEPEDLPDADCYCFGFPCQSFSIAGDRRGFEDTRGTLFFEVMRLAKDRHPKILFAENVKGLLNHDGGATFGTIIRTMDELGYDVEWQLCNSKYFGVPQNRERVFIIGHLRGTGRRKIFPITGDSRKVDASQTENKQLSQEVAYINKKRIAKKGVDVAKTICARDYKGFGTGFDTMNAVIEKDEKRENNQNKECH